MGRPQDRVFSLRNQHLVISLLFFLASTLCHHSIVAQGSRTTHSHPVEEQSLKGNNVESEVIKRELIGSRPPRCEGRCRNCGHCEAIQVPIVPQQGFPRSHFVHYYATPRIAYSRGDDLTNYKPMSWKCKCGDSIFNP